MDKADLQKRECTRYKLSTLQINLQDVGFKRRKRFSFKKFLRMSSNDFENLICLVDPVIKKENTNYWKRAICITEPRLILIGLSYYS